MREDLFRRWRSSKVVSATVDNDVSRCRRIQDRSIGLGVLLDSEYKKDRGASALKALEYTRDDQAIRKAPPGNLYFIPGADLFNGMASIKSSVKTYFDFCREFPPA